MIVTTTVVIKTCSMFTPLIVRNVNPCYVKAIGGDAGYNCSSDQNYILNIFMLLINSYLEHNVYLE